MSFGKILSRLRNERGLTQKEIAQMLGISERTYKNYEYDIREPGHAFLIKAATLLGVTTDYLLGISDKKNLPDAISAQTDTEARLLKAIRKMPEKRVYALLVALLDEDDK